MNTRWWTMAAVLSTFAASLQAQSPGGNLEISPLIGRFFGGKVAQINNPWNTPPFDDIQIRLADDVGYGLRLGYSLSNGLEPELQWSRVETSLRFSPATVPTFPVTMNYYLAGLAYNFTQTRVRPYASLGAGAATLSVQQPFVTGGFATPSPRFNTEARFTGQAAVGLKAFVTPWLGVRVEGRGYASKLGDTPFGVCGGETFAPTYCRTKSWLVNADVGGGLVFAF